MSETRTHNFGTVYMYMYKYILVQKGCRQIRPKGMDRLVWDQSIYMKFMLNEKRYELMRKQFSQ